LFGIYATGQTGAKLGHHSHSKLNGLGIHYLKLMLLNQ